MKCGVFYIDLHGEDSGYSCCVAEKNTIEEADEYMTECAKAYYKYLNLHYDHRAHGVQGTSPIAVMRDGMVHRLYFVNILEN